MHIETSHTFDQAVDRVYAYLSDPKNRSEWQSSITDLEVLTEGPPRVGTRWRETAIGAGTSELEIVVLEPNRIWTESATGPMADMRLRLTFTPDDGSTRVDVDAEIEPKGMAGFLLSLARPFIPMLIRSDLARAERQIASGSEDA